ncbi:hypothetical protein EJ03DRAFT_156561 [Teratosphaeria nubilosa]|uniref:Membrane anchor Opy2 N-terminal domain-containing protein n=1 Tax=Teratosphaeria nubilosa TaxID=161662 RepID=A0A6G1L3S0_9PEZI|nr:hypothetical protein EJ03DRAFT_156561 [Teratosphaeria nubilosa]
MPISQGGFPVKAVEHALRTIFRRCVQCPDGTPSCPSCGKNEICSLVPQSCSTCSYATCIKNPSRASTPRGPNVGAIAGGVVGGVLAVAITVFLIWRFYIKKKREQQELEAEAWEEDDIAQQKRNQHFRAMHADNASTRSRGSLANSILSRASNIIQIAYIPGVMNRNGSGNTSPVPPIPAALRGNQPPKSPLSNEDDAIFFRPGDIRDSTWSNTSSQRSGKRDTQYTRQSITPSLARSSVASEIYHDNVTPMPAQAVQRLAPRMVSVKSASSASSPTETASGKSPVSQQDHTQFAATTPAGKEEGIKVMMPGAGSSPSSSVRAKAKEVTVSGNKGRFPVRKSSDASTAPSTVSKHTPNVSSPLTEIDIDSDDDDGDEHARARRSLLNAINRSSSDTPLVQPAESPFFDASDIPPASAALNKPNPYKSMGSTIGAGIIDRPRRGPALSDIIEEATRRASKDTSGGRRDTSPFSDAHVAE